MDEYIFYGRRLCDDLPVRVIETVTQFRRMDSRKSNSIIHSKDVGRPNGSVFVARIAVARHGTDFVSMQLENNNSHSHCPDQKALQVYTVRRGGRGDRLRHTFFVKLKTRDVPGHYNFTLCAL